MPQSWRTWAAVRPSAPKLSNALGVQEAEADLSGGGTMQTMPIVKVKDLGIALAAYIAQKRREA